MTTCSGLAVLKIRWNFHSFGGPGENNQTKFLRNGQNETIIVSCLFPAEISFFMTCMCSNQTRKKAQSCIINNMEKSVRTVGQQSASEQSLSGQVSSLDDKSN